MMGMSDFFLKQVVQSMGLQWREIAAGDTAAPPSGTVRKFEVTGNYNAKPFRLLVLAEGELPL